MFCLCHAVGCFTRRRPSDTLDTIAHRGCWDAVTERAVKRRDWCCRPLIGDERVGGGQSDSKSIPHPYPTREI